MKSQRRVGFIVASQADARQRVERDAVMPCVLFDFGSGGVNIHSASSYCYHAFDRERPERKEHIGRLSKCFAGTLTDGHVFVLFLLGNVVADARFGVSEKATSKVRVL